MKTFLCRFGALVRFVLSGFDRLRFCGESRLLDDARGVDSYLYQQHIRYTDFPDHAESLAETLARSQTVASAKRDGVPLQPLSTAPRSIRKPSPSNPPATTGARPDGSRCSVASSCVPPIGCARTTRAAAPSKGERFHFWGFLLRPCLALRARGMRIAVNLIAIRCARFAFTLRGRWGLTTR